ncbi:hypothetical protein PP339_gp056 [Mycobacterium phage Onyinye]|uniref:Uncharacterized protein n=1 Tax=Mycobacterium phage Onyinye TaxID=2686235 RepID=A0A6B9LDC9_9CAUD|nr:hypothetical protein PP339_gp056 [Mycobacterium phage Onyinye]QHB37461.1 hypothetical protein SEA_ONYINYE_56 [Mycobacterium phage Onyinye]
MEIKIDVQPANVTKTADRLLEGDAVIWEGNLAVLVEAGFPAFKPDHVDMTLVVYTANGSARVNPIVDRKQEFMTVRMEAR